MFQKGLFLDGLAHSTTRQDSFQMDSLTAPPDRIVLGKTGSCATRKDCFWMDSLAAPPDRIALDGLTHNTTR